MDKDLLSDPNQTPVVQVRQEMNVMNPNPAPPILPVWIIIAKLAEGVLGTYAAYWEPYARSISIVALLFNVLRAIVRCRLNLLPVPQTIAIHPTRPVSADAIRL